MDKIICEVCGTTYPATSAQCPICGFAKPVAPKAPVNDRGASGYQYVRGGRFSNENVRKRTRQNPPQPTYTRAAAPVPAPAPRPQKPANKKGSNFFFGIVAIVLLVVLILSLAWFIVDIVLERLGGAQQPAPITTTGLQTGQLSANVSDLTFTAAGDSQTVIPVLFPDDLDAVFTFSSADASVAVVDENGVVTAVGEGTTQVTVSCNGLFMDIPVVCSFDSTVATTQPLETTAPPAVKEVKISHKDVTIAVNESFLLQLRDSDKNAVDVQWTVSEEGIVSVDGNKITGVKGGSNVVISATYNGKTYKCTVRVKK